ncbi:MAG TPA: molybdopterin-dependent oxidoreductase [Caulobacteraceae bacterium]|jgi:hypothetical protein|nr:molybdopterin-dependent oxidoreductase [Caulobacteraceae bacterium]
MRFAIIGGLACALAVSGAAAAQSIVVKGADDRVETVSPADIQAMHRASVTVPYGDKGTYTGAVIGDFLAEVGAPSDVRLHRTPVNQIVIVTGQDGFTTVLSLAETEKSFRSQPVIVADQENGKPLDSRQGPYRLVIGGELKPARSVYDVIEIELRPVNTSDPARPAPPPAPSAAPPAAPPGG